MARAIAQPFRPLTEAERQELTRVPMRRARPSGAIDVFDPLQEITIVGYTVLGITKQVDHLGR
ncbi:MAG: hypothetical protein HY675_22760 [Chloroflexi bacterium]|nr:hypothetical protein [Chloroflexota bacterium]